MTRPAAGQRGAWVRPVRLGPPPQGHPFAAWLTALLGLLSLTTLGLFTPLAVATGGGLLHRAGGVEALADGDALLVLCGLGLAVLPIGFWVLALPLLA